MPNPKTLDYLEKLAAHYDELSRKLQDPVVLKNPAETKKTVAERRQIEDLIKAYRDYRKVRAEIEENQALLSESDLELRALAEEELKTLGGREVEIEKSIQSLLVPKDPRDEKNIILEIRAGAGGDEAALFVADLFRMYSRYAERNRFRVEVLSLSQTGTGGLKEVIALIEGKGAFQRLRYESGVHRVQRVPATEASGRIHTSTATVAVLPEAEEVEVEIKPEEIRVDAFRASGPGGQNVNKVESAIRITHLPTGIVVSCQDEKSQHKNRAKGMRVLRARLLDQRQQEQDKEISQARRTQVGTGDRSEKIRTYNYPQSRVTDHRIGLSTHNLEGVLDGELNELIAGAINYFQTQASESITQAIPGQ